MQFNNDQFPSIKKILKSIIDELNRFLLIILIILMIVTLFIKTFILDLLKFIILIIIIFRIVSKNKIQRNNENKVYLKIINQLTKPFKILKEKNIYKKCPKCKTTLKLPLPSKRGIQHAKCPNCSYRVTLFTLRKKKKEKIKVEVIKKKR